MEERTIDDSAAEAIRREVAWSWGRIGAAWGVTRSTAAVQGYLLLHGGPLTRRELGSALGLSHRAVLVALDECEAWGIVERAPEKRRSGSRGPSGTAWVPVPDHWEWFRRVAEARKVRETDPVLPLLDDGLRRAEEAGADELRDRIASLVTFVHRFDHAVDAVVDADADAFGHLFDLVAELEPVTVSRLLEKLQDVPADELARAATSLSRMSPRLVRRVISLMADPRVTRLVAR